MNEQTLVRALCVCVCVWMGGPLCVVTAKETLQTHHQIWQVMFIDYGMAQHCCCNFPFSLHLALQIFITDNESRYFAGFLCAVINLKSSENFCWHATNWSWDSDWVASLCHVLGSSSSRTNRNWTGATVAGSGSLSRQLKKEVLFLCAAKVCPTWTGKQEVMRLQVFITLILHSGGTCGVYAICAEGTCDAAKSQTNIMCGQCFQLSTDTHTHTCTYMYLRLQLGTLRGVCAIFHNYSNCRGNLSSAMKLSASQLFLLAFFRGKARGGRGAKEVGNCCLLCHSI